MRIFIRVCPTEIVDNPKYNIPHSAHPPYLSSGRRTLGFVRMFPERMMNASRKMWEKRKNA